MCRFFVVMVSVFCYCDEIFAAIGESAVMSLSAASSLKSLDDKDFMGLGGIFSSKEKVNIESIVFDVEDNMNNNGAVKLDLVIVYTQELVNKLSEMSAQEYYRRKKQLKRDHPDKIKVFQWGIPAEKALSKPIKIKHNTSELTPVAAYVFANYNSIGEHRHAVPDALKKIKIVLKRDDFDLEQSDEDKKKQEEANKEEEENNDDSEE